MFNILWWCVIISLSLSNYRIKDFNMDLYFEFLFWFYKDECSVFRITITAWWFLYSSLHRNKFHIFQSISKCLIHGLRPLNIITCVSYVITYKTKTREEELWWRNVMLFTRNLLMSFMIFLHSHNRKMSFYLAHIRILGSM